MITGDSTRAVLTLAAVTMAILGTTTRQVSAGELTYDATVQVSDNESVFNVSVFPGKAGYDNGTVSGIFGDGTVVDYRFFTADSDTLWSWSDGGAGIVAPVPSPPPENVAGPVNESQNWPNVWITSDPDTGPADLTTNTQAGAQNITGTIDISGLASGTLYFIYGTYYNPNTLSLTMSGTGQPDVLADHTEDPPNTVNKGWVSSFDFSDAAAYDTISYSYTNTDTDASRARFMGVIVDGVVAGPMNPSNPSPDDGATDVSRSLVLSWTPGEYAAKHDVYFGTVFDDVNDATITNQLGVLKSQDQIEAYYPATGTLDLVLGQTYYWRIDEVNAPPDSTIFKGSVWSFTIEPIGYPIDGANITATASSSMDGSPPERTIDGSGLNDGDLHSTDLAEMWLSGTLAPQPTWIEYQFDKVYKLHEMWVWNQNQVIEPSVGYGFKDVTIEYSVDGIGYTTLGTTHEFAGSPGLPDNEHETTVDFSGVIAKYVRLTPNSNWKGYVVQYGLSEVRFLHIPVNARESSPNSRATDVDVNVTLGWRAGREAATHDVYLGADEQAVIDGTVVAVSVTDASYSSAFDLDSTYYWRIDEVNEAETPATWQGDVWNFTTQEFIVVDDFESYNDIAAGEEGSNPVYLTWLDGVDNPSANGSTMGYNEPFQPTMETDTVHGGRQSAPLEYNNTAAALSEVTRTLAPQNWAANGIQTLSLWFYGDPANMPGQLYAKINGVQVNYDGDAGNLTLAGWQPWNIDLTSIGVNLSSVTSLAIGIQGPGATGTLLLDDIRLYPYPRQLITPVEPDPANLVAYYPLDGNYQDASGNNRHGTPVGGPIFVPGAAGQALELDGTDDYVNIDGYKGINADLTDPNNPVQLAFSISNWVKTTSDSGDTEMVTWGASSGSATRLTWRVHQGRLRTEHNAGNLRGNTYVNDGEWHHVALVVTEGANLRPENTKLYVDGLEDTYFSGSDTTYKLVAEHDVRIGMSGPQDSRYFPGALDEVRIYDRALPHEEIAGLAGRVNPFDKPF